MAYISFHDGKSKTITNEQALAMWEVLQARVEPTPKQHKWAVSTKKLYLDRYTAPEDYVTRYEVEICRAVLADYMVDRQGFVTIPDWSRPKARVFAKWHQAAMNRAKQLYPKG